MLPHAWWWLVETLSSWGGRIGCRVLDRHHYLACRGGSDHQVVDGRIQRVRVAEGRWVPARRR